MKTDKKVSPDVRAKTNEEYWIKQWKKAAGIRFWHRSWYQEHVKARALCELSSLAVRIYGRTTVQPEDVGLLSYSAHSVGMPIPFGHERLSLCKKAPSAVKGDFRSMMKSRMKETDACEEKQHEESEDILRLGKQFGLASKIACAMDY